MPTVLVLTDLADVLENLPEHLLVGSDAYGQVRPEPEAIEPLRKLGVDVETLGIETAEGVM